MQQGHCTGHHQLASNTSLLEAKHSAGCRYNHANEFLERPVKSVLTARFTMKTHKNQPDVNYCWRNMNFSMHARAIAVHQKGTMSSDELAFLLHWEEGMG
jgi:hypothetical protein